MTSYDGFVFELCSLFNEIYIAKHLHEFYNPNLMLLTNDKLFIMEINDTDSITHQNVCVPSRIFSGELFLTSKTIISRNDDLGVWQNENRLKIIYNSFINCVNTGIYTFIDHLIITTSNGTIWRFGLTDDVYGRYEYVLITGIFGIPTCVIKYDDGYMVSNDTGNIYYIDKYFNKTAIYAHSAGINKLLKFNNMLICIDYDDCITMLEINNHYNKFNHIILIKCHLKLFRRLNHDRFCNNLLSYCGKIITTGKKCVKIWNNIEKERDVKDIKLEHEIDSAIIWRDYLIIGSVIKKTTIIETVGYRDVERKIPSDIIITKINLINDYKISITTCKALMDHNKDPMLKLSLF